MTRVRIWSAAVVCLVAGFVAAAENGPVVRREIRRQENRQTSIAGQTERVAGDLREVNDELTYNRVGRKDEVETIETIAEALEKLADPKSSERMKNMPWVVSQLTEGRRSEETMDRRRKLLEASGGQGFIVDELGRLAKRARKEFGGTNVSRMLQKVIEKQEKLLDETQELSDKTMGKTEDELTAEEKAEQDRLTDEQNALKQELETAKEELRDAAEQMKETDPMQADALDEAADRLEEQEVGEKMSDASENIEQNQLNAAQEQQQEALDAMKDAQEMAEAAEMNPMAQMEQQMGEMQEMIEQQQELLAEAQDLDQNSTEMDFNEMQADQSELAGELQEMMEQGPMEQGEHEQHPMEEAHGEMEEAEHALGEHNKEETTENMEQALGALRKTQQQMAMQFAQMQQQLAQQQQQQQQQMMAMMPGMPKKPMDQQTPALKTEEYDPQQRSAKYGAQNQAQGPQAWQVGLEPKEREILSNSAKEKFPPGYERLLSLYYRNLAAVQGGE